MPLSKEDALRAYARVWNNLELGTFSDILVDDFHYESQMVIVPMTTKAAFLEYLVGKVETIRNAGADIVIEMGEVYAYNGLEACAILSNGGKRVGLALATVDGEKLVRLDLCIVPAPSSAKGSGEVPT